MTSQKIIGIDISEGMLEVGKEKVKKIGLDDKIKLEVGDSINLNFDNESFDAVTVAFGVRNFESLEKGLREINRVLRKNGVAIILELTEPLISE